EDPLTAIDSYYEKGVTDEFMEPISLRVNDSYNEGRIQENDAVICFNFRTDRCRQITRALTQENFPEFDMTRLDLHYVTMTKYDKDFSNVHVLFNKDNLKNTLGEILADNKKHQLRAAETEKYPHVTFFFSGGREKVFDKEERVLVASPKVATYDLQPEMSAVELTSKVVAKIAEQKFDFICLNYANPDMVGHTGIYDAIIKAVETVDRQVGILMDSAKKENYDILLIADHGNADFVINEDGSPNTAHSLNLVPVIYISYDDNCKNLELKSGRLADIAPTVLDILEIPKPMEMTGESLIKRVE
ncbi:MAG: 2,3-bisphosphoglycerate-independent phosphoglycerate mutase, partial [Flavobacteriales bacterium]|nr:2,3-bisphosphoglycerate-independent phosphoglycerate mutase [Flavobacteriales bacterium]